MSMIRSMMLYLGKTRRKVSGHDKRTSNDDFQ